MDLHRLVWAESLGYKTVKVPFKDLGPCLLRLPKVGFDLPRNRKPERLKPPMTKLEIENLKHTLQRFVDSVNARPGLACTNSELFHLRGAAFDCESAVNELDRALACA